MSEGEKNTPRKWRTRLLGCLLLASPIHGFEQCMYPYTGLLANRAYIEKTRPETVRTLLPPRTQVSEFIGPSHVPELQHYLYGGSSEWLQRPFRAIFLGGAGEGSVMLASQLQALGMEYEVVQVTSDTHAPQEVLNLVEGWEGAHESSPLHVTAFEGSLHTLAKDPAHLGTYDYVDNSDAWQLDVSVQEGLLLSTTLLRAQGGGVGLALPSNTFITQARLALQENAALRPVQQLVNTPMIHLTKEDVHAQASKVLRQVLVRLCGPSKAAAITQQGTTPRTHALTQAILGSVAIGGGWGMEDLGMLLEGAGLQVVGALDWGLYEQSTFLPHAAPCPPMDHNNTRTLTQCYAQGELAFGSSLMHEVLAVFKGPSTSTSTSRTPPPLSSPSPPPLDPLDPLMPLVRNVHMVSSLLHHAQQDLDSNTDTSQHVPSLSLHPRARPVPLTPLSLLPSPLLHLLTTCLLDHPCPLTHLRQQARTPSAFQQIWTALRFLNSLGLVLLVPPLLHHTFHPLSPLPPLPPPLQASSKASAPIPASMRDISLKPPPPHHDALPANPHTPPVRLSRVPCSPPHCLFPCRPSVPLSCPLAPFHWPTHAPPRLCPRPPHKYNHQGHSNKDQENGEEEESERYFKLYPISFAVPKEDIVDCVPTKSQAVGTVIPYESETYIFGPLDEAEYKRDYRRSYFGVTMRKAGWDCLRHYEILASGSVPLFSGLEHRPADTLTSLPIDLLLSARNLSGVGQDGSIDVNTFDQAGYDLLSCQLLEYTKRYLTTEALASYVLEASGQAHASNVLFLSYNQKGDYMCDLLLHGLKSLLHSSNRGGNRGGRVVDVPRRHHAYLYDEDQPPLSAEPLYGFGFTYAHRLVDDPTLDRSNIPQRIANKEFDLIVYGSVHRGLIYWDEVMAHYPPEQVLYIDGEDDHGWEYIMERSAFLLTRGHYFLREMPPGCPPFHPEAPPVTNNRTESLGVKKRKRQMLAGVDPASHAV